EALASLLRGVGDLERLTARNATGRSQPRDLAALATGLERVPALRAHLKDGPAAVGEAARFDADTEPVVAAIRATLVDDPAPPGSGDPTIRPGFNAELDEVRTLARDGRSVIASIQQREATR